MKTWDVPGCGADVVWGSGELGFEWEFEDERDEEGEGGMAFLRYVLFC